MHYEGFLLQATPLSITLGASHPCANHYLHNLGTGVVCLLFWVLTKQGLFISLSWSVQSKLYVEQKGLWGNDPPWEVDHPQLAHTSGTLPFGFFALLPFCPFGFLPFCLFAILPFSLLHFQPVCSFSPSPVPFHWPLWEIPCGLNCTTTNLNSNLSWC